MITLAESLGGYESLAELPYLMTHASIEVGCHKMEIITCVWKHLIQLHHCQVYRNYFTQMNVSGKRAPCLWHHRQSDKGECKGRVQKPESRKMSVMGWGGVPPFSANFFPLTFWPAAFREGGREVPPLSAKKKSVAN